MAYGSIYSGYAYGALILRVDVSPFLPDVYPLPESIDGSFSGCCLARIKRYITIVTDYTDHAKHSLFPNHIGTLKHFARLSFLAEYTNQYPNDQPAHRRRSFRLPPRQISTL